MRLLPVLTPEQSRAWDHAAEASGRPLATLMESAGRAVASIITDRLAMRVQQGVLVACGPGNNGGDGWVIARALRAAGAPVWATEIAAPKPGIAADARSLALHDGVTVVPSDGPWPDCALIIDALLGTGAEGAPRDEMLRLLQRIADLELPVVAVDGPTGLDLGTGMQRGPVSATMSVTFGGVRRGHLLARDEVGDVIVVDIGLPAADASWPTLVSSTWAATRLPPFKANAHKGTRGRVVIIGGSPAMIGAARLAARSAFAAGAGLVHVVAPEEALQSIRVAEPDVQSLAHEFSGELSDAFITLIERADAIAIGPGLGRDAGRADFVLAVLAHVKRAVVDADALTVLKGRRDELAKLAATREIVCTPHIGEFRTLFGEFANDLETNPWDAAAEASASAHLTVLLKGVPTIVASPNEPMRTVAAGNPGLATGGSGDVLTGIITALLAQKLSAHDAAAVGAEAHGLAADNAARRTTARSMRPMDVINALPDVWRTWARPPIRPRIPILAELPAPRTI